jgi:glycosyltransferase involved in cell wall biosynthesis
LGSSIGAKLMGKKRICWITSDEFLMVDLPIMPALSKHYDVDWHIFYNKEDKIDYSGIIAERISGTTIRCQIHKLRNRRRNPIIIWEYWQNLRSINKRKYQCLYFNIEGLPYFFPLVSLMFNRNKVLCAAHHVSTPVGAVNYGFAKLYMDFILKTFKYFQVFSRNQYALLQKKYPGKKSFYAPFALMDYGKSTSSLPKEPVIFLFFGFIREYKRVDILINAANMVFEKTKKKFIVQIYGSCTDWDKYRKLIIYPEIFELKIEPIPNEEIPRIFKGAHYFVMPYQDLAQSATLTVAFSYNLPVIASDIDSFKEIIVDGKNGILFEHGSVESLAAAMMNLLDADEEHYKKMKENLSDYIDKNYSTENIVKRYREFIESINAK